MQSYASPGRVITVANIGTDAVAVRADQPYRLGNLVGVTDAPAGVGDDLNLCVEGVFEQMVDLADGLEAAEAGTPVLMNVATFALVVGLTDATDHVHFGVLAERMTRRRVALVKLMPATAAAPATGGGDGGNDPTLVVRIGAAEDAIVVLDGRMDAAEEAIAGSGGAATSSRRSAGTAYYTNYGTGPAGGAINLGYNYAFPANGGCHLAFVKGQPWSSTQFVADEDGLFCIDVTFDIQLMAAQGSRLLLQVQRSRPEVPPFIVPLGIANTVDPAGYAGIASGPNGSVRGSASCLVDMATGWTAGVQLGILADAGQGAGFVPGDISVQLCVATMEKVA